MKKTLSIATGILIIGFSAQNLFAQASDITQTDGPGQEVTIDTTGVNGAPDEMTFNPSTNVVMDGASDETGYAITSYHTQTVGKDVGQAYGMAGDSNKMFFVSIAENADEAEITDTNSDAAFGAWTTL